MWGQELRAVTLEMPGETIWMVNNSQSVSVRPNLTHLGVASALLRRLTLAMGKIPSNELYNLITPPLGVNLSRIAAQSSGSPKGIKL